jgi:hypothetical protein
MEEIEALGFNLLYIQEQNVAPQNRPADIVNAVDEQVANHVAFGDRESQDLLSSILYIVDN